VRGDVAAACELLGFDPMYVANEGRFVAFVPAADVHRAIDVLRAHAVAQGAVCIGAVSAAPSGAVTMTSRIGATRIVDMISGEQLPRIC
jgi:hydrogenase expression/formation protein HypE